MDMLVYNKTNLPVSAQKLKVSCALQTSFYLCSMFSETILYSF